MIHAMSPQDHKAQFGVFGLGVMGRMLALNAARKGFAVAGWDRAEEQIHAWKTLATDGEDLRPTADPAAFALALERPRRVLLMVPAGDPVDDAIRMLTPHLEAGDILIDGGNSHPADTARRTAELEAHQVHFVGMGVSGGEQGALEGPALMPGGSEPAWEALQPVLEKLAAQGPFGPCVDHMGPGGAGHFVKTVHNGIEYGDMQLLAEVWDAMTHVGGMDPHASAEVFAKWNEGPLESFLVEVTAKVLRAMDPDTGQPLIDVIVDRAGQKGTGRWTAELALEFGVPVPTIQAALLGRGLSAYRGLRQDAARVLSGPTAPAVDPNLVSDLHDALLASRICTYAQGFHLMTAASEERDWGLRPAAIARVWTDGCILRGALLRPIMAAFEQRPDLPHLLLDETLAERLRGLQAGWRRAVSAATRAGVPVLALGARLSYYDSLRRRRLPQSLTQGQRDCFGAHHF